MTNNEARAVQDALRLLQGDRSISSDERALAIDLLALLPALLGLRAHGHGELITKVQNGKVVHGSARFDWKVESEAR